MNLHDLIERLQELADLDPNADVMLAFQPNWPLAFTIDNVRVIDNVVWIANGSHPYPDPYAPRAAWDEE